MSPAALRRSPGALAVAAAALLSACAGRGVPSAAETSLPLATASARPATVVGSIEPAPVSDSLVYPPNPAAIVVAIDPGHGGCLDWGVPDPSERGVELAEKTLTLEIARLLGDRLSADGIGVIMTRHGDDALAGDDHPPLGCNGAPWRDVNGDGHVGFGPDLPEGTRTRDELQARLDLANLTQADALVSIHINSPSEQGRTVEIAFSETYYTDETAWAGATERLAAAVQSGVATRLEGIATYERQDRGITAHNLYMVAPPLGSPTQQRPNPLAQPARGGLMPVVLAEVGSITVRSEHDLLANPVGQQAVADGLFEGLAEYFATRAVAARIAQAGGGAGAHPEATEGSGPPFWAPAVRPGGLSLRVTNTGTTPWDTPARLLGGWQASDEPYLYAPPQSLARLGAPIPPLDPGETVSVEVSLEAPPAGRAIGWISLETGDTILADIGSPALQISTQPH